MKKTSKILFEKSVSAAVSAIELYNKPNFEYREDAFCILMVNAWELLLKSKLVKESKNGKFSLYIKEAKVDTSGNKTKQLIYRKNKVSGTNITISIFESMRKLSKLGFHINQICSDNIESMVELRNCIVHFNGQDKVINKKILEFGTSSLKNYTHTIKEWFNEDLSSYNFYLMPLSFFNEYSVVENINTSNRSEEIDKLFKYLSIKESGSTLNIKETENYSISSVIEVKFLKSSSDSAVPFRLSNDKNATEIRLSEEDIFKKFPLDYENMRNEIKRIDPSIKHGSKLFNTIKSGLEDDPSICHKRKLNPKKAKSSIVKFYSYNFCSKLVTKYNEAT
jgi:hypothetical protein